MLEDLGCISFFLGELILRIRGELVEFLFDFSSSSVFLFCRVFSCKAAVLEFADVDVDVDVEVEVDVDVDANIAADIVVVALSAPGD